MPRQLVITRLAHSDLNQAYTYRAARAPAAAQKWYERLRSAIASLSDPTVRHPQAAEAEFDPNGRDIRELLHGKGRNVFRVLYVVSGDTVTVHRVRHASQDRVDPDEL